MSIGTIIKGTGSALPKKIVDNHQLAQTVDTSHDWIYSRTGINARRIAADSENSHTLALAAAKDALESSNTDPSTIDAVIIATCTPAQSMPSTASLVQRDLGLPPGIAFDINVACSGFIYAINIADILVKNAQANSVLLIGVDVMSSILDWQDRSTCVLFGDGAGAVIIEKNTVNKLYGGILSANGAYANSLAADPKISMNGREVFKHAVKELERLVPETLEKVNKSFADIDWLVAHQANIRIIHATAKLLKLPLEKAIVTIDKHANTSAASIPLALDDAIKSKKIQRGDVLMLEAFGAGFTWGSFVLTY